jgi:hypothetical protein
MRTVDIVRCSMSRTTINAGQCSAIPRTSMFFICSSLANKGSSSPFMQQQTKMKSQVYEEITVIIVHPLLVTYKTDNSIVHY